MTTTTEQKTKPAVRYDKPEVPPGDFAVGERTTPTTTTAGDFASGEHTLPTSTTVGDFASGEHTLPITPETPVLVDALPSVLDVPDQK